MSEMHRTFLPAAGRHWALPLYDPMVKLAGGERARRTLLGQAALRPGNRVLDVGCGTGTLAVLIKRVHPDVDVAGIDPDLRALARARRKADRAAVVLRLDRGFADELPYGNASFDRVVSSFVLHHLEHDQRPQALGEIRRVLEHNGSFHLLDFDGPDAGGGPGIARWLHAHHRLQDNGEDRLVTMMRDAGFEDVKRVGRGTMVFGVALWSCYEAQASRVESDRA